MANKTKEQIYDEQIAPLMAKIIDIAKASNIAIVADFEIGNDRFCSTVMTNKDSHPRLRLIGRIIAKSIEDSRFPEVVN
ncbi:MAG: hypothetical protein ABFD46_12275 [Armatimonadota bacterium]